MRLSGGGQGYYYRCRHLWERTCWPRASSATRDSSALLAFVRDSTAAVVPSADRWSAATPAAAVREPRQARLPTCQTVSTPGLPPSAAATTSPFALAANTAMACVNAGCRTCWGLLGQPEGRHAVLQRSRSDCCGCPRLAPAIVRNHDCPSLARREAK